MSIIRLILTVKKSQRSRVAFGVGITDPLLLTEDDFIISGHRRYAASRLAGLKSLPCRRASIRHESPEFLVMLCEGNLQRAKATDEVIREEVIKSNPTRAGAELREFRRNAAAVKIATDPIEGRMRRAAISEAKAPFLQAVLNVIWSLREFWPLSERLIHYRLFNDPPLIHANKPDEYRDKHGRLCFNRYCNQNSCYKSLTDLVTRAHRAVHSI